MLRNFKFLSKNALFSAAAAFVGATISCADVLEITTSGTYYTFNEDGVIVDVSGEVMFSNSGTGTASALYNLGSYWYLDATLQYHAWPAYASNASYSEPTVADFLGLFTAGTLTVEKGTVILRGNISMYANFGTVLNNLNGIRTIGEIWGISQVTLGSGTILDIHENSYTFLANVSAAADSTLLINTIGNTSAKDVIIHIESETLEDGGSLGNITGSSTASVYKTGDGNLTLLTNTDFAGAFYLAGGNLYLNGSKSVSTYNRSVLQKYGYDLEYGLTLANASSINLAGTSTTDALALNEYARSGYDAGYQTSTVSVYNSSTGLYVNVVLYKTSYFPTITTGTTLVIEGNEIIRNFQSMFALGASATDDTNSATSAIRNAAYSTNTDSLLVAGTGSGTYVGIAEDAILAIYQESGHGGIYKGTICGLDSNGNASINITGGTVLKYGSGDLALILEGANFSKLVVLEGNLITNISTVNISAGVYDWATGTWTEAPGAQILGGSLYIIENDITTLKTRLLVDDGADLHFSTYYELDTLGGKVDCSNNFRAAGTIQIKYEQRFVTGDVYVEGGVKLILTATEVYDGDENTDEIEFSGGAFGLANAIILIGEDSGKISKISFGNTNQKINNLTGDAWTEVELGSGTMFANITSSDYVSLTEEIVQYGTFQGYISGVGNVIKTGSETLTLTGGTKITFYGAFAAAEGDVVFTEASSFANISALILNSGTTTSATGNQYVAALYGASDSTLTITAGTLTVGTSATRETLLARELSSIGNLATTSLSNSDAAFDFSALGFSSTEAEKFAKALTSLGVLTDDETEALLNYLQGDCNSGDWKDLGTIFGKEISRGDYSQITEADFARLYLSLLAQSSFADQIENADEMISRLSFDGALSVDQLKKIDSTSKLTISGTLSTSFIEVTAGTLEIDFDTLGLSDEETDSDGNLVSATIAGNVADGIFIEDGAIFEFNSEDSSATLTLNEIIYGKGNVILHSAGTLVLGENVTYTGTTTIHCGNVVLTLRESQGEIVSEGEGSLTISNDNDVTFSNEISIGGDLIKIGAGTVVLNGELEVGGNVIVEEGNLTFVDYIIAQSETEEGESAQTVTIFEGATFSVCVSDEDETLTSYANFLGEDDEENSSGTLEKTGAGTLVLAGTANDDFAGTISVSEGTLVLNTENMFKNSAVEIAADATLKLNESQIFAGISGQGEIVLADGKTLTITSQNDDFLEIDNSSGTIYEVSASETFTTFSGTIYAESGSGTFILNGSGVLQILPENEISFSGISFEVAAGKLVVDAALFATSTSRSVTLSGDGEIVFFTDEDLDFTGTISMTSQTTNIGKLGAGTLAIDVGQIEGADLFIYEGTLSTTGFSFKNATIAAGATLEVTYNAATKVDLSNIEGSGTILLSYDGTSPGNVIVSDDSTMLSPFPNEEGRFFNGILSLKNIDLEIRVGNDGIDICSIEADENSSVTIYDESIAGTGTFTIYEAQSTEIAGAFTSTDLVVVVTGAGTLTISSLDVLATFAVVDGSLGLDSTVSLTSDGSAGTIYAAGEANLYFSSKSLSGSSLSADSISAATIDIDSATYGELDSLKIYKVGENTITLDFSSDTDGGQAKLSVSDALWDYVSSGAGTITLGVAEETLILKNISNLADFVLLETKNDTTLAFEISGIAAQTLDKDVSGDGNVSKIGAGTLIVSCSQSYTGTTTVSAGILSFEAGISLETSALIVASGATVSGGVTLTNGSFVLESGGTLKLDVGSGDTVAYSGEIYVAGTIVLSGANSSTYGYAMTIFEQLNSSAEAFSDDELREISSHISNDSTSLMVSQPSAGTIVVYAIPNSYADVADASLRNGLLESFIGVIDSFAGLGEAAASGIVLESDLNEIGKALNKVSAAELSASIANLSPLSYAYMTELPTRLFENDIYQIAARTSQRRFDSAAILVDNDTEFFASVYANAIRNSKHADSANYDYKTYGIVAGADKKLANDVSLVGILAGYDTGTANIHDAGGKIESENFRATAFASTIFGADFSFFANAGITAGTTSYDVRRKTILGNANGDTSSWNVGVFGEVGKGFLIYEDPTDGDRLLLSLFTGLAVNYVSVDSFKETGTTAALDTDSFDAISTRWTLGASLDYVFPLSEFSLRIGLGAGFAHEFTANEVSINSRFANVDGSDFKVKATMFAENIFYIGPTLTLDLSDRTACFFGYKVEYGTNDVVNQNFHLGFRRSF